MAQAVERALQNKSCGDLVDFFGPFGARHVGFQHHPFCCDRGQAFVLIGYRNFDQLAEVTRKGTGFLTARAFGSVHVAGKAQNDAADFTL